MTAPMDLLMLLIVCGVSAIAVTVDIGALAAWVRNHAARK